MKLSATLSIYFGRQFVVWVLGTFLAIMGMVFLLDLIELLRRAADKEASFGIVLEMAVLKTPQMGQAIFPFAILAGGMMAFSRMTRSQELVVARSAGVSVWQFLLPALVVALFLGVLRVTVFNPIASVMSAKFEALDNRVLRNRDSALTVSPGGLWIREKTADGHSVLHARGIVGDGEAISDVIIFLFKGEDRFASRIDAATATLQPGFWKLEEAVFISEDGIPSIRQDYRLTTRLTVDNIQDSFASPTTMSFWELPRFILILENAGFTAVRHRLHWHALLASPLLLCAMVLIAATFSLRLTRQGGTLAWACAGLFFGFFYYFMSDVVFALGLSSRIPEVLAAWTPATVTTLLGAASLLHLEDG
ncbi:MAG: LPS export ABC transporter permease LptG [Rhodospirillaceae bacterium]|nr:LPS export ABC transporter permease LptG [Rhodospirillaceae bacterium]